MEPALELKITKLVARLVLVRGGAVLGLISS